MVKWSFLFILRVSFVFGILLLLIMADKYFHGEFGDGGWIWQYVKVAAILVPLGSAIGILSEVFARWWRKQRRKSGIE